VVIVASSANQRPLKAGALKIIGQQKCHGVGRLFGTCGIGIRRSLAEMRYYGAVRPQKAAHYNDFLQSIKKDKAMFFSLFAAIDNGCLREL
jgi:hypothetical protein